MPLCCVYSRWDEREDFHCASGDSDTLPVNVCVYAGCRDNNRIIGGLQKYSHITQEDTIEDLGKNTQSFTHPSNPYFTRQDE